MKEGEKQKLCTAICPNLEKSFMSDDEHTGQNIGVVKTNVPLKCNARQRNLGLPIKFCAVLADQSSRLYRVLVFNRIA